MGEQGALEQDWFSPLAAFTPAERRLIKRLPTPDAVQRYLNGLPYNTEKRGDTLRSFRQVVRHGTAHCLEAALFAACVLSTTATRRCCSPSSWSTASTTFSFLYRKGGRWGTVARSRHPGLHGRKPVFKTLRSLAMSYFDAYVDPTGCIEGFGSYDLRKLDYDWRFARRNMWKVERTLIDVPHHRIKSRSHTSIACACATMRIARNTGRNHCSNQAEMRGRRSRGVPRPLRRRLGFQAGDGVPRLDPLARVRHHPICCRRGRAAHTPRQTPDRS